MFFYNLIALQGIARTAEQRQRLIKKDGAPRRGGRETEGGGETDGEECLEGPA